MTRKKLVGPLGGRDFTIDVSRQRTKPYLSVILLMTSLIASASSRKYVFASILGSLSVTGSVFRLS